MTTESTTSLYSLMLAASKANDGEWEPAMAQACQRLKEDEALYHALSWPLMRQAMWAQLRAITSQQRGELLADAPPVAATVAPPGAAPTEDKARALLGLTGLAAFNRRRLLDFPLQNGVKLGDASADAVKTAFKCYFANARPDVVRGRWLHSVWVAMGGAERVSDALDDAALNHLYAKANRDRTPTATDAPTVPVVPTTKAKGKAKANRPAA